MNIWSTVGVITIPVVIWGLALWFDKHPPKKINSWCGYRTSRSMKSQETWDFANACLCSLWKRLGAGMTVVSVVLCLIMSRTGEKTFSIFVIGAVTLQTILILLSIKPIEDALKERFNEEGKRIK